MTITAPESEYGNHPISPSPSDFGLWQDLQENGRVFEDLAAYIHTRGVLEEGAYPENVSGVETSTHMHSMLGIDPLAGRTFMTEEGHTGRNHVAMISSRLWERRFRSAKSIIGQTITLDGVPHTLVGIFPDRSGLDPNNRADVWTPLPFEEVECLLLTAVATAVGILAASWILDLIKIFLPLTIPRLDEIGIDQNVVLWTCGVSAIASVGLAFLASPAVSRLDLEEVLKRRVTLSAPRSLSLRYLLLTLQITAALVLALGAMLLTRSFLLLQSLEPGFQSENVLTMRLSLRPRFEESQEWPLVTRRIVDAAEQLPSVNHVGITYWLPLTGTFERNT